MQTRARSITAVFDWGHVLAGDPLDDLDRLLPLYELHIALGELQYVAFRGDPAAIDGATDRLERLITGGERR